MAKKVIIASTMAEVADQIWALETAQMGVSVVLLWRFQVPYSFFSVHEGASGSGGGSALLWVPAAGASANLGEA